MYLCVRARECMRMRVREENELYSAGLNWAVYCCKVSLRASSGCQDTGLPKCKIALE